MHATDLDNENLSTRNKLTFLITVLILLKKTDLELLNHDVSLVQKCNKLKYVNEQKTQAASNLNAGWVDKCYFMTKLYNLIYVWEDIME